MVYFHNEFTEKEKMYSNKILLIVVSKPEKNQFNDGIFTGDNGVDIYGNPACFLSF